MDLVSWGFNPQNLTDHEITVILREYRRGSKAIAAKIQRLTDGSHTILSETAIAVFRSIRDNYNQRIESLVSLKQQRKQERIIREKQRKQA